MLIKWEKMFLVFGKSVSLLLPSLPIDTHSCFRCQNTVSSVLTLPFSTIHDSFLYDGARINDDDTPDSLDMEDNGEFLSSPPLGNCLTGAPALQIRLMSW